MKQKHFVIVCVVFIVAAVLAAVWFGVKTATTPAPYNSFAQCLGEKGATFYGAFWCPHCTDQKKLFGRSAKHLPYVECSTPNGQGQTRACTEKGVSGYPTWEFADGSRESRVLRLEELAEKTGCVLPTTE